MILFTYLYFFILSYISFFIPGRLFLNILGIDKDLYENFVLSWISGITLFILFSYIFAYVKMPQLTILVLIICLLLFLQKRLFLFNKHTSIDYWLLFIVLFGSLSFLSLTFFSGWKTTAGMQFFGTNIVDGILHLAYIKSQAALFPPQNPNLAGITLHGYHYFYDFLLSRFVLYYNLSAEDLYFRLFPVLISLFYGGSILLFSKSFTKNKFALRIIVFLAYFAQSTTSIFLLFQNNYDYLGLNQSVSLILNPSIVLGTACLCVVLYLLPKVKEHFAYGVITGVVLGILSQLKIYAGIVGLGTLVLYTFYAVLLKKKSIKNYLYTIAITGVLTFIAFVINNFGSGSFVYAPLLFYKQYMHATILEFLKWELKMETLRAHHNLIRISLLFLEAIAITWFINLGLRIILIFQVQKFFTKKFWLNEYTVSLFFAIFIPIIIPSFFIQSFSVFDTVQFFWISLILLTIPTGLFFAKIFNRNRIFKILAVCLLIGTSLGGYLYAETIYLVSSTPFVVSTHDLRLYEYIAKHVPQNSFIVYLPDEKPHSTPIISAMTGRFVYYEGGIYAINNPDLIKKRKKILQNFLSALQTCKEGDVVNILKEIGSFYIVSTERNKCLFSPEMRGSKIESDTLSLYNVY